MGLWSPSTQKLAQDAIGGLAMGLGYTTGAYTGYGVSNTADPLGIHKSKAYYSKPMHIKMEMPYGYGYGRYRRRYSRFRRRRYSRYSRYSRYRRYRRYY
jgi:hypothetical protein